MQVEIKIDANCTETKVIVLTDKMTDEINELVKRISDDPLFVLVGFQDDSISILNPDKIVRIYSANQKVYALSDNVEYTVRLRLYELERRLNSLGFVRISNSEIINITKVKSFDLSFSGTICVKLQNNSVSYVSRRYVAKIKQVLGI